MSRLDERLTVSVEEAAELLGIGRSSAYEAARRYEATNGRDGLPVIRLGRRLLVPKAGLRRLLGANPERSAGVATES